MQGLSVAHRNNNLGNKYRVCKVRGAGREGGGAARGCRPWRMKGYRVGHGPKTFPQSSQINLGHVEQRGFQPEGIKKREDAPLSRGCPCTPNPSFQQGERQGTSWGVHRAGPLEPQTGTGLGTPCLASSCRGHKTLLVLNLGRRGM